MKNPILTIIGLFIITNINAQQSRTIKNFEGIIKFENKISFKSEKDSLLWLKLENKKDSLIGIWPSEYRPNISEVYIKPDSCLHIKYVLRADTPVFYIFNIKDQAKMISLVSGKADKFEYHFKWSYPEYKRKKKTKTILGYQCVLYRGRDEKQINELWVAPKLRVGKDQKAFSHYMHDGAMILEQSHFIWELRRTYHTKATEIVEQEVDNIFSRIKELEKLDDREKMYAEIEQNKDIVVHPIKVGDTLQNLFYRDAKTFDIKPFNQYKGNGKYLMIELWGTWCAPCLAVTPKIKELYLANKEKLDLLSFNWGDRTIKRVNEIIAKKGMTWNHAFGTRKLINMLNPKGGYPTMLFLDDDLEVIFIGNPNAYLTKVEEILK